MSNSVSYAVGKPEDYLGGFIATGAVAIVQTVTPLLVAQLWKKDDLVAGELTNPWITYMWKAMQAGGVVGFGLPAGFFLASFAFHFSLFEKIAYLVVFVIHAVALGVLSTSTVMGYGMVAIADYQDSTYTKLTEIWVTLGIFLSVQLGAAVVGRIYAKDTVLYLVSEEMKDLCDKFGLLCSDYGVMTPENLPGGSL